MENVLIVKNLKSLQILQHLLCTSSLVTVKLLSGFAWKWDVLKGCTYNFENQACLYMCVHTPTLLWMGSWQVLSVGHGLAVHLSTPATLLSSHWELQGFNSRVHQEFPHSAVAWHCPNAFICFPQTSGNQLPDFRFLVFIASPALLRTIEFVVKGQE